jgi:hypothetical protein
MGDIMKSDWLPEARFILLDKSSAGSVVDSQNVGFR